MEEYFELLEQQTAIETKTAKFNRQLYLDTLLGSDELILELLEPIEDRLIPLCLRIISATITTSYVPIDSLLGMLRGTDDLELQEIADTISKLIDLGILLILENKIYCDLSLPDEIINNLNAYSFPLPLVVEPSTLNENTDCGYYTKAHSFRNITNLPLDVLEGLDINLEHLNKVNSIPLSLVPIPPKKLLPPKFDRHYPKKSQLKLSQYNKFIKCCNDIYSLLAPYDKLYLTNYYDKRGRVYCNGYHINYQGTDYAKACIQLHKKENLL